MLGLMDVPPLDLPDTKRESLLNFLQGENDKKLREKVDAAFKTATLYNIEGVFVLDWENGLTEEYTCKNNIWVHIGTNNNLYKMKIEQMKKDNQKDAPFYQGMTKTETVESLVRCMYGGEIPAEHFLTKNKVFVHKDIVVIEGLIEGKNKGYKQFCKYNKDGKFWTIEDPNNPKELAPLASGGEDMECPNDGLLALIKQMYPNAKCIWLGESELEPELTPQDLIQAAKDELIGKLATAGRCKTAPATNIGWAKCIKFLEETLKNQPNGK